MHLLVVSATELEITETISWLAGRNHADNSVDVNLLITGVGQLQTGWFLQQSLGGKKPDLMIQAGIGGSDKQEDTGHVYAIGSDKLGDLGLMEKKGFTNLFEMGLANPDQAPFSKGKLVNPYQRLLDWSGLPLREAVTVNEIKSNDFAGFQRNAFPLVESMEGAAFHYAGLMTEIPFLQIRAVSNVTGERDKKKWQIKEAVKNLNETLISLIKKLENTDETDFRL